MAIWSVAPWLLLFLQFVATESAVIPCETVAGTCGISGSSTSQLDRPRGIWVNRSNDDIYIVDGNNYRVVKWESGASSGTVVAGGNGGGNGPSQFSSPNGVVVTRGGDVIVSDQGNNRLMTWGPGANQGVDQYGYFNKPRGITLDSSGNLYIAAEHEVTKHTPAGERSTVAGTGTKGTGNNELDEPYDVEVDADGALFVLDEDNRRVMRWTDGASSGTKVAGGNGKGQGSHQFHDTEAIAVDSFGYIWVADAGNDRVMRWQPGGFSGEQMWLQGLDQPHGLAFNAVGHLYVVDSVDHCVRKCCPPTTTTTGTFTTTTGTTTTMTHTATTTVTTVTATMTTTGTTTSKTDTTTTVTTTKTDTTTTVTATTTTTTVTHTTLTSTETTTTKTSTSTTTTTTTATTTTTTATTTKTTTTETTITSTTVSTTTTQTSITVTVTSVTSTTTQTSTSATRTITSTTATVTTTTETQTSTTVTATITTVTMTTTSATGTATSVTGTTTTTTTTVTTMTSTTVTSTETATSSTGTTTSTTGTTTSITGTSTTSTGTTVTATETITTATETTTATTVTSTTSTSTSSTATDTTLTNTQTTTTISLTSISLTSISLTSTSTLTSISLTSTSTSSQTTTTKTETTQTVVTSTTTTTTKTETTQTVVTSTTTTVTHTGTNTRSSTSSQTTTTETETTQTVVTSTTTTRTTITHTGTSTRTTGTTTIRTTTTTGFRTTITKTTTRVTGIMTATHTPTTTTRISAPAVQRRTFTWAGNLSETGSRLLAAFPHMATLDSGMLGTQVGSLGTLSPALRHTQQCTGSASHTGLAEQYYFTCRISSLWVAGFYSDNALIDRLRFSGASSTNVGMVSQGSSQGPTRRLATGDDSSTGVQVKTGTLALQSNLTAIWTKAYGGGSPGVNHLVVAPAGWRSHADGVEKGTGEPADKVYYIKWAGEYPDEEFVKAADLVMTHFPRTPPIPDATTTSTSSTTSTKAERLALDACARVDPVDVLMCRLHFVTESARAQVASGNLTKAVQTFPQGTMVAEKLPQASNKTFHMEQEGLGKVVTLPMGTLDTLAASPAGPWDSLLLTFTDFDKSVADHLGGQEEVQSYIAAVVDIDLRYVTSGFRPEVKDLAEPILFLLPGVKYQPGMTCVYWDKETEWWSTWGVSIDEEWSEVGGRFVCRTYHLSFFAAVYKGFVETWACAKFGLFNKKAIAELAKTDWMLMPGTIVCWTLLLCLLGTFILAAIADYRRNQECEWSDDFLLVAPDAASLEKSMSLASFHVDRCDTPESEDEDNVKETPPSMFWQLGGAAYVKCLLCAQWTRESSALREAFDDILSNWFEHFAELRSLVEALFEGLEIKDLRNEGVLATLSIKATTHLLLASSRRLVGASMNLSDNSVSFVMKDKELRSWFTKEQEERAAREVMLGPILCVRGTNQDWKRSSDKAEAWTLLHEKIGQEILGHFKRHNRKDLPRVTFDLFWSQNPLGTPFVRDVFKSCKVRVLMLAVQLTGALAFSCVFYEASGMVKGKPRGRDATACSGSWKKGLGFVIGRLIAVGIGSLLVAGLPGLFLESLQTKSLTMLDYVGSKAWKRKKRAWRLQDIMVWTLGLSYIGFCVFFMQVFLASVGSRDHRDWGIASFVAVLTDLFLLPGLIAVAFPGLAITLMSLLMLYANIEPAKIIDRAHTAALQKSNLMMPITEV